MPKNDEYFNDEYFMKIAIELAKNGCGNVHPNPLVGSVIVKDNEIIGKGYHKKYGFDHAEVEAIQSVENRADLEGSTLYVNLEPCSHYGKTPPCVNAIIKAGIKKVVIANIDPNPEVNLRGIKILKNCGIEVIVGVLENKGQELNKQFFERFCECLQV